MLQEKPDPTIPKEKDKKAMLAKIQRSGTRGLKRESQAAGLLAAKSSLGREDDLD